MAKIPDRETQYGRQTPNGAIEWISDKLATKLGWTTPEGRVNEQDHYDAHLQAIGIVPSAATDLKFFSRERFIGYTDAAEIVDFDDITPAPSTGAAPVDVPDPVTTSVPVQAAAVDVTAVAEVAPAEAVAP